MIKPFLLITVFIIHHSESFIVISCFQISIFCLGFTVLILCCVDDWRMVLPFPSKAWWTLPWSLGCQLQAGANVGCVCLHDTSDAFDMNSAIFSFLRISHCCSWIRSDVVRCAFCCIWSVCILSVWWWPDSLIKRCGATTVICSFLVFTPM